MRLIDADRLLDRCIFYHLPNGDLAVPIIDVQHAPTVEAPDINVGNMDTTTHDSIPAETGGNDEDRTSGDCISRQAAIDALKEKVFRNLTDEFYGAMQVLDELPSAQPEQHEIGYSECANAMLKMWVDNVLTDGEYNRIMDKLNAHWAERGEDG